MKDERATYSDGAKVVSVEPEFVKDADSVLEASLGRQSNVFTPFETPPVTIRQFARLEEYGRQGDSAWPAVIEELENIFGTDTARFAHQEAFLCWAIGAGKSFLVSMAFTYMLYWVLNLKDPQRFLGLAPGSYVVWLNQSINEDNAKKVIFHEVQQRVEQSPWFRAHGYLPNPRVRSELQFPKHVILFPGNSSVTFPQGYNVLGGVVDEAAALDSVTLAEPTRESPADAIYNEIRQRVRNRFAERGLIIAISSPKHAEDFMERKIQFAVMGDPERNVPPPRRVYWSRKAVWDTKPGWAKREDGTWEPWLFERFSLTRATPDGRTEPYVDLMVPSQYIHDFRANPELSLRDLAAIATRTGMMYFWDPEVVRRPWMGVGTSGFNPLRQHPFDDQYMLNPAFKFVGPEWAICHAHVDLGLTRDACGVAVGHVAGQTIIAGEVKPVIALDVMLEIRALPGREIDFQDVRNLLYALKARGVPLQYVTFDGWQSVDSIQQLNKRGIEAEMLSVDRDSAAYDTFKEAVYEGRLDYYYYLPLYECVKSLLWTGKKVDHTPRGKKDVSDGVAGVCQTLTERWMVLVKPSAGQVRSAVVAGVIRAR